MHYDLYMDDFVSSPCPTLCAKQVEVLSALQVRPEYLVRRWRPVEKNMEPTVAASAPMSLPLHFAQKDEVNRRAKEQLEGRCWFVISVYDFFVCFISFSFLLVDSIEFFHRIFPFDMQKKSVEKLWWNHKVLWKILRWCHLQLATCSHSAWRLGTLQALVWLRSWRLYRGSTSVDVGWELSTIRSKLIYGKLFVRKFDVNV